MAQIRSTAYYSLSGMELISAGRVRSWERLRPKSQQVYLSIWTCLRLKCVPYIAQRSKSYELDCDMQTGAHRQKYPPAKLMFTLSESHQA